MKRQQSLETFLNDKVRRLALGLYEWRGHYYEVVTYQMTLRRHNWSQYIRLDERFSMREMSEAMIKKYYPRVTIDK
jgi:hypothetical protein